MCDGGHTPRTDEHYLYACSCLEGVRFLEGREVKKKKSHSVLLLKASVLTSTHRPIPHGTAREGGGHKEGGGTLKKCSGIVSPAWFFF